MVNGSGKSDAGSDSDSWVISGFFPEGTGETGESQTRNGSMSTGSVLAPQKDYETTAGRRRSTDDWDLV
jgi:hypothetical protein